MRLPSVSILLVLGAGCGPGAANGVLLLLDAEARSAGLSLSLGSWRGAPVTPIAVALTDEVELLGDGPARRLELRRDSIGEVKGPRGEVSWRRLSEGVRGDSIRVRGREADVQRFAQSVDGVYACVRRDVWIVSGPDVLAASAWLSAPGLIGFGLVEADPESSPGATKFEDSASGMRAELRSYGLGEGDDYGRWRRDGRLLIFEAEGRFESTDEARCARASGRYEAYRDAVLLIPEPGPWELLERGPDGIFRTVLSEPTGSTDAMPSTAR